MAPHAGVNVTHTYIGGGKLLPPLPAGRAWRSSPANTAANFASARLCLWDYHTHAPALTFFQTWASHFQLQNLRTGRDPYVLPVRAAAVLLLAGQRVAAPAVKLSARMRVHPTLDARRVAEAAQRGEIYEDRDAHSDDVALGERAAGGRRAAEARAPASLYETLCALRVPGRLYVKAGTHVDMPLGDPDGAKAQRRRFSTAQSVDGGGDGGGGDVWWGVEWDYMRTLEMHVRADSGGGGGSALARRTPRRPQYRNVLPRTKWFAHASWMPAHDGAQPRLVTGLQHRFLLPAIGLGGRGDKRERDAGRAFRFGGDRQHEGGRAAARRGAPRRLPLTMRFGVDIGRGALYITPVAEGTYQ